MNEIQKYLQALLINQGIESGSKFAKEFAVFASDQENIKNVNLIRELQKKMTKNWQITARRLELKDQYITFPNGMMGKPYHAIFDFNHFNLNDVIDHTLTGFENTGLVYDNETKTISGIPEKSGDIILEYRYNFKGEENGAPFNTKKLSIIINSDPKSLWKDIASDINDSFYKPDNVAETTVLGSKTLVVASKRGRSHANVGSFRDDDYAYSNLANGWSIISISDGAGSATFSRKGSSVVCEAVVAYFKKYFSNDITTAIDVAVETSTEINKALKELALPYLSKAANYAFEEIETLANSTGQPVNAFHATLSYMLIKKYDKGYAVMTFGVGDCPMGIVNKERTEVTLMNKLDVGEFGGGTRFITMPEIFRAEDYETRFNFEFVEDFSYLALMTDGIYDPKFETEANLRKIEKWSSFFEDLEGNNSENIALGFTEKKEGIERRLSAWMDFWSTGNHDDRTLVILF